MRCTKYKIPNTTALLPWFMASCLVCKSILGKHFQILLQFQEINRAFSGGENFNLTHDLPLFHHPSFFTFPTSFFSLIE